MPQSNLQQFLNAEESGAINFRRPRRESVDPDITPMIDVTFLLLIFFLVASSMDVQSSAEIPEARYGTGIPQQECVILTVAERSGGRLPLVYLGDGKKGEPLPDDIEAQERLIAQAVAEGLRAGKSRVLIKAEKGVKNRDVTRIAAAASQEQGVRIYLGVVDKK
ncbi:hypothetical protein JCM19992_23010 [Thermostilla marina]